MAYKNLTNHRTIVFDFEKVEITTVSDELVVAHRRPQQVDRFVGSKWHLQIDFLVLIFINKKQQHIKKKL